MLTKRRLVAFSLAAVSTFALSVHAAPLDDGAAAEFNGEFPLALARAEQGEAAGQTLLSFMYLEGHVRSAPDGAHRRYAKKG